MFNNVILIFKQVLFIKYRFIILKKNVCLFSVIIMKSPSLPETPVRRNFESVCHYPVGTNIRSTVSVHMTPPSGITKFIAHNPFDADLTSRLHLSVISPSVFESKKVFIKLNT